MARQRSGLNAISETGLVIETTELTGRPLLASHRRTSADSAIKPSLVSSAKCSDRVLGRALTANLIGTLTVAVTTRAPSGVNDALCTGPGCFIWLTSLPEAISHTQAKPSAAAVTTRRPSELNSIWLTGP